MHRLGLEQVVTVVRRDASAPGQIGAGSPDMADIEVGVAAVQQRGGQVRGLGRIPFQQGDRLVKRPQRSLSLPRPHEHETSLKKQHPPFIRRSQALRPLQQPQPVLGTALLGLPLRQDPQQPGGQRVVCLVQLDRVGLGRVLRPAQVPQPGAGVAGADGGTAGVAFAQAALTRLLSSALGTGEPAVGAFGAPLRARHLAATSGQRMRAGVTTDLPVSLCSESSGRTTS